MNKKRYYSLNEYCKQTFGDKVYRLSLNGGMSCPNRDGSLSTGGCTFCSEGGSGDFAASYDVSIVAQITEAKTRIQRKTDCNKFIAYFQAYTNTYAELEELKRKYEEALAVPDVVGLVIGTRPDCMPDALLDYLEELNRHTFLIVEYGVESTDNATLKRINRGHTFEVAAEAIRKTAARGIRVGAHIILGLPGESREMLIAQAGTLSALPLTTLKLHQLQLIKGTRMASEYEKQPSDFHLYSADEYIDLVIDYVEHLRPDMVMERFVSQSPKELLIAPDWGLKNHEFTDKVKKRMRERDAWQGKCYKNKEEQ